MVAECYFTLSPYCFIALSLLFGAPFRPTFFTEIRFGAMEVVLTLEELFPIVLFTTCFGITTFFAAGFTFFLINGRCRFGLLVTFAVIVVVVFVVSTSAFRGGFLTFFSGNLDRYFTAGSVGTVQRFHDVIGFFFFYLEERELLHQVDTTQLYTSTGVFV